MRPGLSARTGSRLIVISLLGWGLALPAAAQYGGPHTTSTVGPYNLAPPPSVTSIGGGRHLPNPLPSVTSIPNYGYHYNYGPYYNGHNAGYHGGRYRGGGWAYAIPYYYPVDSSYYGYDYVGAGPDLYSGPPVNPNDSNLHMIVEQPPARPYGENLVGPDAYAPPPAAVSQPPAPVVPPAEVKPGEPTELVFRDGKHQEVTNYAIMGDSLYVFDQGRKQIALADLDIAATIKANDDRGLEFRMPPSVKKNATTDVPQTSSPDQKQKAAPPANIAAVEP